MTTKSDRRCRCHRRVPPALLGRVASLDFFVSIVPVVVAVVATVWAKLPADELAHPLRDE